MTYEAQRRLRRQKKKRLLIAASTSALVAASCSSPPVLRVEPKTAVTEDQGVVPAPKKTPKRHLKAVRPSSRPSPVRVAATVKPKPFKPAHLSDAEWKALGELDVTSYCPSSGNVTASGKTPRPGMVATLAPIPFGTRLRIEGLGVYVVEDRIGHSSDVDVWMDSCADAVAFGRRHLRVWEAAA